VRESTDVPGTVAAVLSDMEAGGLDRLDLRTDELTLVVSRHGRGPAAVATVAEPPVSRDLPVPLVVRSPGVGLFQHGGTTDGELVAAGTEIGWLDTNGARTPVEAPAAGTLHGLDVQQGQFVEYGQELFRLNPGTSTEVVQA
jgi:biotin carboxyl carrier protein